MPRMNGAPSPQLIGKATTSAYVTHCKECLQPVYEHERRVWSRKPLGICHQSCVDGAS